MKMQHFWHRRFICSKFNILQIFCPPFGSRKRWRCQDTPGIGKPFRLKHGKRRMRSSAELRTDPGFLLASCWFWGHKRGLVPPRCPLGQHSSPHALLLAKLFLGLGEGDIALRFNSWQIHATTTWNPCFSLSWESTRTSITVITQHHCPGSFSTPSQPPLGLGSSASSPLTLGFTQSLGLEKSSEIKSSYLGAFSVGRNQPQDSPPLFLVHFSADTSIPRETPGSAAAVPKCHGPEGVNPRQLLLRGDTTLDKHGWGHSGCPRQRLAPSGGSTWCP